MGYDAFDLHGSQEWQHQLRSSLHPALFGAAYIAADKVMDLFQVFLPFRAFALVALPKIIQSVLSALSDFYTWKLAEKIYGQGSNAAWSAVCDFLPRALPPYSHSAACLILGCILSVLGNYFQPMALVLLHEDVFQLPGNDSDYRGPLSLAMGDAWGL